MATIDGYFRRMCRSSQLRRYLSGRLCGCIFSHFLTLFLGQFGAKMVVFCAQFGCRKNNGWNAIYFRNRRFIASYRGAHIDGYFRRMCRPSQRRTSLSVLLCGYIFPGCRVGLIENSSTICLNLAVNIYKIRPNS